MKTEKTRDKGNSLLAFPSDFVVIDLETTGCDPFYDEIVEFGAIRVRNGEPTERMQVLICPAEPLDEFIQALTGITNEMLEGAPALDSVLPGILAFIGSDVVVGHNVNFDINFLFDAELNRTGTCFQNDYVDTLRISRRLLSELPHHRLSDLAQHFSIPQPAAHRSLADCETTLAVFQQLKWHAIETFGSAEAAFPCNKISYWRSLKNVTTDKTEFDTTHPLYGKHCVFTGALERMTRAQASQLVVDFGGFADGGVTAKTNFLILGNNDYCSTIKDGKSAKQKKAEAYKLAGQDIEILSESVFYDLLEE